jgi:hypothetical protein
MNIEIAIYTFAIVLFIFIIVYYYRQYAKEVKVQLKGEKIIRAECPDYWMVEGPSKCRNANKMGVCLTKGSEGGLMDFDTDFFKNPNTGNYAKCRWAKKCKVAWDGIDDICV